MNDASEPTLPPCDHRYTVVLRTTEKYWGGQSGMEYRHKVMCEICKDVTTISESETLERRYW